MELNNYAYKFINHQMCVGMDDDALFSFKIMFVRQKSQVLLFYPLCILFLQVKDVIPVYDVDLELATISA